MSGRARRSENSCTLLVIELPRTCLVLTSGARGHMESVLVPGTAFALDYAGKSACLAQGHWISLVKSAGGNGARQNWCFGIGLLRRAGVRGACHAADFSGARSHPLGACHDGDASPG